MSVSVGDFRRSPSARLRLGGLLLLFLALLPVRGEGAELIAGPGGVTLRVLHQWEAVDSVLVNEDGTAVSAERDGDRTSHLFTHDALCRVGASYAIVGRRSFDQNLEHLCWRDRNESIRILFLSDTQLEHRAHRGLSGAVARLLDAQDVDLIVNGGDIVEESTEAEWRQYREVAQRYTSVVPIVPVVGNHEYYGGDASLRFWNYVYGTSDTARTYYVLDYGKVALVVLNSNLDQLGTTAADAQTVWLRENLARLRSAGRTILVTHHHAVYTSGARIAMPSQNRDFILQHWEPLYRQYGVKLVLNGHEHLYERLHSNGVNYLVSGPAGGPTGFVVLQHPASLFAASFTRTVSQLDITSDGRIRVQTYRPNEELPFDTWEIG